jgi:multidrug resistance efflux pump
MLELLICSVLTILPDYLYRRHVQGKRIGREITFYSVWFELRWGITTCLLLTVALITIIFYFHPTTSNATAFFRVVPIVPETSGRVVEVNVRGSSEINQGEVLFRLDDASQKAAVETARRRIGEIDAALVLAQADIAAATGQVDQAQSGLDQVLDELATKQDLMRRNADVVARRELERLETQAQGRRGALTSARAMVESAQTRLSTVLPAQRASAVAALQAAEVELAKTVVRAGIDGRVEQFALQVGDFVNPFRPAGALIPDRIGRRQLFAGFGQIEAQVIRPGMIAEAVCLSNPMVVVPLVVTQVQDIIATGQFRGGEQLIDAQQVRAPGTVTAALEPLFEGGLDRVPLGSSCIVNAYSDHHDVIADPATGTGRRLFLHLVDATSVVHAMILRVQALVLPVKLLVLSGH